MIQATIVDSRMAAGADIVTDLFRKPVVQVNMCTVRAVLMM